MTLILVALVLLVLGLIVTVAILDRRSQTLEDDLTIARMQNDLLRGYVPYPPGEKP